MLLLIVTNFPVCPAINGYTPIYIRTGLITKVEPTPNPAFKKLEINPRLASLIMLRTDISISPSTNLYPRACFLLYCLVDQIPAKTV